jgi:hypothetical protein
MKEVTTTIGTSIAGIGMIQIVPLTDIGDGLNILSTVLISIITIIKLIKKNKHNDKKK